MAMLGKATESPPIIKPKRKSRVSVRLLAMQVSLGLIILVCWEAVIQAGVVKPLLASGPRDVAAFMLEMAADDLWRHLWSTLQATVIAFLLACAAGIFVGVSLGLLPTTSAVLSPYIYALNAMPRIALGPLFLLYFGISQASKVALAFSLVFFIVLENAQAGVKSVDDEYLRLARSYGATKRQLFVKVLLPASTPSIFAGMRLGMIYSLLGVVTMEIIASQEGLGARIILYGNQFNLTGVYAVLFVLAIVASLINVIMGRVETFLLRWKE